MADQMYNRNADRLHLTILWSSGDPFTAHSMVLLYAVNCLLKDWWDEVTVVLWGASIRLVAEDPGIRDKVRMAANVGVKFSACSASARQSGAGALLEETGIEIRPWGKGLTSLLQGGGHLLSV